MKEKPILMSGAMVRATLSGMKSETRRVIKPQPKHCSDYQRDGWIWEGYHTSPAALAHFMETRAPYKSGQTLWVRETWYNDIPDKQDRQHVYYRADGDCCEQIPECQCGEVGKPSWRPGIFMPRWACRLQLLVTQVRAQQLQDLNERAALAEGIDREDLSLCHITPQMIFRRLWNELNAKRGFAWETNPWVWVIEFAPIFDHTRN